MPEFFVNLTLILIGLLGLFVTTLMLFSYKSNIFVNIYLVSIFILCSFRNIVIGLFEFTDFNLTLFIKLFTPICLIASPALYLYFKSLVKDYTAVYKKDLIHVLFPIMNFGLNLGQEYFPFLNTSFIENIRFVGLIIFFSIYSLLSFNLLYNNLWKTELNVSVDRKHYLLIKNWTLFLFTISSFLFLRIIYSIYINKNAQELFHTQHRVFFVVIFWLLIYGKILISPGILYGYSKLKKQVSEIQDQINIPNKIWTFNSTHILNVQDKKLSNTIKNNIASYISDIENFADNEHPFRNSKYSFSDFAKSIKIPASHVNYIFKYHCNITFVEYKNYCRITDVLELINNGDLDTLTLEGLANKVGFSSYNSFYTAFKKHTKLAPKAYVNSLNNTTESILDLAL